MSTARIPSRNLTIDVAKGLGILLVVFGHNWLVLGEKGELYRIIYSFHVPLFLLLSGVMLKRTEPLGSLLRSKADALLKPYLVVLIVLGVAKAVFNPGGALTYFAGMFYAAGDTLSWVPMWFLPHLFLALVLTWALLRGTDALRLPAWVFVPVLWTFGVWSLGWFSEVPLSVAATRLLGTTVLPGLPLSADLLPLSAAFLITGHLLHTRIKTLVFSPLLFGLLVAGFFALHMSLNLSLDLNMRRYDDVVVSSIEIVTGAGAVLCLSAGLAQAAVGRLLAKIGSASLFILIFHMVVQDRVFMLLEPLSGWPQANAVVALYPW